MSCWYRTFATKDQYFRHHTAERSMQRYGTRLTTADQKAIAEEIRQGHSTVVRVCSLRRTVHQIHYRGIDWTVVYDNKRKCLLTALPPEERNL